MIPFGPWEPDAEDMDSARAGEAKGVLPGANSYLPWPSLVEFSEALPGPCRGFVMYRTTAGGLGVFAGTATGLHRYDGGAWEDVSGATYNLPANEKWSFQQFGNKMHATNANDGLLFIDVDAGTGTNFAANPGAPPAARLVRAYGDQLMLGGLTTYPSYIFLSGRNDTTWWTLGERDCTWQPLPDGGAVTGLSPLETGLIFQEGAIRRIVPRNDDAIFQISKIEDSRGLAAPDSLIVLSNVAYYLSEEGWMATDGSGASRRIGVDRVDDWFRSNVNIGRLGTIQGTTDPARSRFYWACPASGNSSSDTMDFILCYDLQADRWSWTDVQVQALASAVSTGYTMDNLDALLTSLGHASLDEAPFSLDSRFLLGGAPTLAAFSANDKLSFFTGASLAATLETADFQPIPLRRAFVKGCQPFTDAADATIAIGRKERQSGDLTWGPAATIDDRGWCSVRSFGRIQRVRMSISAGAMWNHAQGIELDVRPDGGR